MPIYYVVAEIKPVHPGMWTMYYILKVIECNFEDFREMFDREVEPLLQSGRNVQGLMFYREPTNPFKDFTKE